MDLIQKNCHYIAEIRIAYVQIVPRLDNQVGVCYAFKDHENAETERVDGRTFYREFPGWNPKLRGIEEMQLNMAPERCTEQQDNM